MKNILKKNSTAAPRKDKKSLGTVSASLLSVLTGLVVGGIITLLVAAFSSDITFKSGVEGVKLIFFGLFSTGRNALGELTFGFNAVSIGNLLFRATPVIMTGLSVALAFKAGLFNIGAPGQYLTGTAATLFVALSIPSGTLPSSVIWILAFISGLAAGALWGAVPGFLKAYFNINEVLSCIMTNWIAANLVTWFFESSDLRNAAESGKIGYIMPTKMNGVMTSGLGLDKIFRGSQANAGIFVAIVFSLLIYVIIYKTTFGYTLKACGSNRHAAEYAGIKSKKITVLAMALAGMLSGGGAALYYLSGDTEFFHATYQSLPSEGFNGIPIALLAVNNPIGVIFSGLFMSMLNIAGQQLKNLTSFNEHLTDIIIGAIVYLSAFALVIRQLLTSGRKKLAEGAATTTAQTQTHAQNEILRELKSDFPSDEKEENG